MNTKRFIALAGVCLLLAGAAQAGNLVQDPGFDGVDATAGPVGVVDGGATGTTWMGWPGTDGPRYYYTYSAANGGNQFGAAQAGDASLGLMGNGTHDDTSPGFDNQTFFWGIWLYYDTAYNSGLISGDKTRLGLKAAVAGNTHNAEYFQTISTDDGGFVSDDWVLISGSELLPDQEAAYPETSYFQDLFIHIDNSTVGGWYYDNAYIYDSADFATFGSSAKPVSPVVPEPATMSLLAVGGIALLKRRRRA